MGVYELYKCSFMHSEIHIYIRYKLVFGGRGANLQKSKWV